MPAKQLGQLLLELGWISDRDLIRALHTQEVLGGRIGTCLLEVDALNEQLLSQALQQQLGVEAVRPLDLHNVPPPVFGVLPPKVAVRCQAIPYRLLGKDLWVALIDVHNLGLLDEIAFATGKTVRARIANEHRIEMALEHYYDRKTTSRFKQLYQRLQEEDPTAMILPTLASDGVVTVHQASHGVVGVESRITKPAVVATGEAPEFDLFLEADQTEAPPLELDTELVDTDVHDVVTLTANISPPRFPNREGSRGSSGGTHEDEIEEALDRIKRVDTHTQPVTWIPVGPEPRGKSVASALLGGSGADSTEEVIGRLYDATTRDELGRELLEYLTSRFRRVCLVSSSKDVFRGWMGGGDDFDVDMFSEYKVSNVEPSVFLNLTSAGAFYAGALAPMPAHERLMQCWNAGLPGEAIVVPIRLGDRVLAFLFCDPGGTGLERSDIEELCHLAASMSSALGNLIVRKKRGA